MSQSNLPSRLRQSVLAIAIAACGGLAIVPASHAQAPATEIHLPAQELGAALDSLASQTGMRLLYSPAAVEGRQAPAVDGTLRIEEALQRLLAGSGLVWSVADGVYAVRAAQSAAAPGPKELAPVTVTATRTEHRVETVPASVTIIGRQEIATQQPQQIVDLLRNVEGVDVAGYGSPTSLPTIRMRGVGGSFAGQTTQVLIDGMPIETPAAGIHLGAGAMALHDLERVEVVRGPASALYGPSAVGGVVNLMSKRWSGAPGAEAGVVAGSHRSLLASTAVGGAWDAIDFRLSASDYRTDGYLAQPKEDPWGSRDLGPRDGTGRNFGLKMGVRPADNHEITLAARSADLESAWLGGHPNYRMSDNTDTCDLGYRYEAGQWGVFKFRYRAMRQKTHLLFDDEYYNMNPGSLILGSVEDRIEDSRHLDVQADLRLGRYDLLTVGFAYGLGEYTTRERDIIGGAVYDSAVKSELAGVYAQDEHRFTDRFLVMAGGRLDRYEFSDDIRNNVPLGKDSSDTVFNPRLAARLMFSETSSMYASVGTGYVPATNVLKYRSGVTWLSNPDLRPETSTSYEFGVRYRQGPWAMRTALFHTDYEDMIASIRVGAMYQFQNISRVSIDGFEIGADGQLGSWQPYLNYTYTDARIKENRGDPLMVGKHVQRIAPHKLNLGVSYAPVRWFYARVSGRHVDQYYFNDRNTEAARNPAHFVADIKLGWRLADAGILRAAEVSVAVNNVFDRNYREQQYEYMDGCNVWLNLNARF